jgi:lambda family phage portal protein
MNLIDRLVGYVSPAAGIRRHQARRVLTRAFEAASPRDTWRPRRANASANADHAADAATLRAKVRTLVQNVPYMRASLEGLVSYVIGTGISTRATGRHAAKFNEVLAEWHKVCDADNRLNWFGMQAVAHRAMEQDGEVLIRLRPRRPTDGLPIPLQLQLLEIDWLDASRHGTIGGAEVVNGIEYDALGRPAAYWLWDRHPGEMILQRSMRSQSVRVPAKSIIHLYNPERPGQGRGFPRAACVIARARDLQLLEDAELARKNLESRAGMVASGDVQMLGDGGPPSQGTTEETGNLGELAGGGILRVPAGLQLTTFEPKAAPGHVENLKMQLQLIATGWGVPYELTTGDVSQTNFSSARVRRLDFKRLVEAIQWNVIIPRLIEPVVAAAQDAAALAGIIPSADHKFDHSTPKWDYVNPEQDIKADQAEIAAGLSSISEKLRARGYSPAAVFEELKTDLDTLKATGVLDILLAMQGNGKQGAAPNTSTGTPPP